jgi:hypothetical protein
VASPLALTAIAIGTRQSLVATICVIQGDLKNTGALAAVLQRQ